MDKTEPAFPRALTVNARRTLDFLLSGDDPRMPALRAQAVDVVASSRCACGCPTIGLRVDGAEARAIADPADFVIEATTREDRDPDRILWLIMFVRDGWLTSLELAFLDTIPPAFPALEDFVAPTVTC